MSEPDFEQIARQYFIDYTGDPIAPLAELLRHVWNARGAADVEALSARLRVVAPQQEQDRLLIKAAAFTAWLGIEMDDDWITAVSESIKRAREKGRAAAVDPPPDTGCDGDCNPYEARCGAKFCTFEDMTKHDRECKVVAVDPPPDTEPR